MSADMLLESLFEVSPLIDVKPECPENHGLVLPIGVILREEITRDFRRRNNGRFAVRDVHREAEW